MRTSLLGIVGLAAVSGMLLAAGASAQATAPSADASKPEGKAKVVFYCGRPAPLKTF
jgi:hypothetical protein